MAQRTSLSEAQVELLRWIGAGCPPGVYESTHHRISVAALTRRGPVDARGHGPTWTATLTSAGRSHLDQVDGSNPPLPRQANLSATEQLAADVIDAGGTLQVPRHTPEPGRVDWQIRVRQATRRGKVPPGKQLTYVYVRGKSTDEIWLIDAPEGTELILLPVPAPERVARCHPTVPTFRKNVARLEMADAALPRASRILQALVVESEARGLTVTAGAPATKRSASSGWSAPTDGQIALEAPGATVRLPCNTPCRPRAGPPPSPSPHDRVANDGRPRLAGNTWANMTWGPSAADRSGGPAPMVGPTTQTGCIAVNAGMKREKIGGTDVWRCPDAQCTDAGAERPILTSSDACAQAKCFAGDNVVNSGSPNDLRAECSQGAPGEAPPGSSGGTSSEGGDAAGGEKKDDGLCADASIGANLSVDFNAEFWVLMFGDEREYPIWEQDVPYPDAKFQLGTCEE